MSITEAMRRQIYKHKKTPVLFVCNTFEFFRALGKDGYPYPETVSSVEGVEVRKVKNWPTDKVVAFYDYGPAQDWERAVRWNVSPKVALETVIEELIEDQQDDAVMVDGRLSESIEIIHVESTINEPDETSNMDAPDDAITIHLRPEFAVYVLSNLEIVREVLDKGTGVDATPNEKSRVASLEVLCSEIARALDEQASRDLIDGIITDLIERYT
jgi:hypothetical protein